MLRRVHAFAGALLRIESDEEIQVLRIFPIRPGKIGCGIQGMQRACRQLLVPEAVQPAIWTGILSRRNGEGLRNPARGHIAQKDRAEQKRQR